jgi:hypothetical protein
VDFYFYFYFEANERAFVAGKRKWNFFSKVVAICPWSKTQPYGFQVFLYPLSVAVISASPDALQHHHPCNCYLLSLSSGCGLLVTAKIDSEPENLEIMAGKSGMMVTTMLVMLVVVLEVASAATLPNCSYPAVYAFGDSLTDTGNSIAAFPEKFANAEQDPNGILFPTHAADRFTDGKLFVDFLGKCPDPKPMQSLPWSCPF